MTITGLDAHHIIKVLRMPVGEKIQIVSSDQVSAIMEISALTVDAAFVRFVDYIEDSHEPQVEIILAQGLPKGEKMDYIVQKATELGVTAIIPLRMERSIVKLVAEKAEKKRERWQKIVAEAAKQSKRDIIPQVMPVTSLKQLFASYNENIIMAYEAEQTVSLKSVLSSLKPIRQIILIIGPEGGIAKEEITLAQNSGVKFVSLGKRILRTETAGVAAIAAILYETGDLGGHK